MEGGGQEEISEDEYKPEKGAGKGKGKAKRKTPEQQAAASLVAKGGRGGRQRGKRSKVVEDLSGEEVRACDQRRYVMFRSGGQLLILYYIVVALEYLGLFVLIH